MAHRITFLSIKKSLLLVITLAAGLSGCASSGMNNGKPNWLYGASTGVVASCGFNIRGHYYQQECAVQRARERLAAQQGVTVSSVALLNQSVSNNVSRVSMDTSIYSEVEKKTVKAKVKDSYYDTQRDEYYVWMISTN